MKVFDFTNGTKGAELGEIKRANALHGWLVRKDDRVFQVSLANAPEGWDWHAGATWLRWVGGEPQEDVAILPEDFGVQAICFCVGQMRHNDVWQWAVVGTQEWNREACKRGILKATFSHTATT